MVKPFYLLGYYVKFFNNITTAFVPLYRRSVKFNVLLVIHQIYGEIIGKFLLGYYVKIFNIITTAFVPLSRDSVKLNVLLVIHQIYGEIKNFCLVILSKILTS